VLLSQLAGFKCWAEGAGQGGCHAVA